MIYIYIIYILPIIILYLPIKTRILNISLVCLIKTEIFLNCVCKNIFLSFLQAQCEKKKKL